MSIFGDAMAAAAHGARILRMVPREVWPAIEAVAKAIARSRDPVKTAKEFEAEANRRNALADDAFDYIRKGPRT